MFNLLNRKLKFQGLLYCAVLTCSLLFNHTVYAEYTAPNGPFDETFRILYGKSNVSLDSQLQLDASTGKHSAGTQIDLEDTLGLDSDMSRITHTEIRWRILPKHSISLSRSAFRRNSTITANRDFQYENLSIASGASISNRFDLAMDEYHYGYSAYLSERQELRITLGINAIKLDMSLTARGEGVLETDEVDIILGGSYSVNMNMAVPAPVIGVGYTWAIAPWWIVSAGSEYLEFKLDNYDGKLINLNLSTEVFIADHIVLGASYRDYHINISAQKSDFTGRFDWDHKGPVAYLGMRF